MGSGAEAGDDRVKVDWTDISGVRVVESKEHIDGRGTLRKLWDATLHGPVVADQVCISTNKVRGTVRGLHMQTEQSPEIKTVWCAAGSIWDVLVDLRRGESTYGLWTAVELDSARPQALQIPAGVAHGFQTLAADSTIVYLITGIFTPGSSRTVRWDDPRLDIAWPLPIAAMSLGDRTADPWQW
jgi:dTDP-4-dehydrorhamnose 3,5-epimerase